MKKLGLSIQSVAVIYPTIEVKTDHIVGIWGISKFQNLPHPSIPTMGQNSYPPNFHIQSSPSPGIHLGLM
jgi:hypothetical protein